MMNNNHRYKLQYLHCVNQNKQKLLIQVVGGTGVERDTGAWYKYLSLLSQV